MAVIFYDTFNNRGPQATLGNASETGQAYISVGTCVAGVTGGQAYGVSGDHENGWQGFNPGVSNVKVSMIFAKSDIIADYSTRLVFRGQDVNNFWHIQVHADGYGLERKVGGSWTVVHTDHSGKANGDLIEVECNGTSITVRRNGTAIPGMSVTSTVLQTATSFGFSFFQGTGTAGNKIDEFKIEDFSSSGSNTTKNFAESTTVSDAVVNKTIGKVTAETVTLTDSISMVYTPGNSVIPQTVQEIMTITDTIQKVVTRQRSETISAADTQATKSIGKIRSETFTLSEILSKFIVKTRTETISITDLISKLAGKVPSETVTVGEGSFSKQISVLKADTVPITDTRSMGRSMSYSDTVTVTDSYSKLIGQGLTLTDSIAIVDSISKSISKLRSDAIASVEADQESVNKKLSDIISSIDSIALLSGKVLNLTDTVVLTDVISKSVTKLRSDSTSVSETSSRTASMSATLYDIIITSDTVTVFAPNAPVLDLIGIINLEGEQTLYVYLAGSQDLIVNLEGGLGPMAKEGQNFEMYAGESKFLDIPLKAQNGSALNLSNATVKFEMKKMPGYPEIEVTKTSPSGIALNTPQPGSIRITLSKNDTIDLSGVYNYFVSVVDSNNYDSVTTVGDITIKER